MTRKLSRDETFSEIISIFVISMNQKQTFEIADEAIITGLRNRDSKITRDYFYGYCRMAYYIHNRQYGLETKPGMDFYTLAHEYYLALDKKDFRQLEDHSPSVSLKTWMINGFRFVILDKLKMVEKEHRLQSLEERVDNASLQFDIADNHFQEEVRTCIDEICHTYYGHDSRASLILQMILLEGFKGKETAEQLGMTPSAVTQRFHKMMEQLVIPYFKHNFTYEEPCSYIEEHNAMPCTQDNMMTAEISMNNKESIRRSTPDHITTLQPNEIFVFGSNLRGMHGGGAARMARLCFGAVMGQGTGLQGQSYAIPTMQGGTDTIRPYVDEFITFAQQHPDKTFLVTRIGCGIAGFDADEIAPLFAKAVDVANIYLPDDFWDTLTGSAW